MKIIRCGECHRFLGKEAIKEGEIKLKCPKCKNWTIIIAKKVNDKDQR